MSEALQAPWLTILGLGEDYADEIEIDLSTRHPQLERALDQAEHIFGHERFAHLAAKAGKQLTSWAKGFDAMLAQIKALKGTPTLILATGDPSHFGIAGSLARYFEPFETKILPSVSAFSKAAAQLGWRLEQCEMISLHGRDIKNLQEVAALNKPILALTSDASTIHQAAELYMRLGLGEAQFDVLHHLGGAQEYVISCQASDHSDNDFGDFQTLAIHPLPHAAQGEPLPTQPFQGDGLIHDSQITKYEQRLLAIAKLAPQPGDLLLDIGAGCGSIALEWCRAQPAAFAICVEKSSQRAAMIVENAQTFGLQNRLRVIEDDALDYLQAPAKSLQPNAVFLGGGVSDQDVWLKAWDRLAPGGRLVAHAVTLKARETMLARYHIWDGDLVELSLSKPHTLGAHQTLKPQLPILQYYGEKPLDGKLN